MKNGLVLILTRRRADNTWITKLTEKEKIEQKGGLLMAVVYYEYSINYLSIHSFCVITATDLIFLNGWMSGR